METWRAVVGYEGLYEVSDQGRVRSLDRKVRRGGKSSSMLAGQMKALQPQPPGHLGVRLSREGATRSFLVHRLVLEAFVGPCPPEMECRHLNDDPANNRLENLKWGTRSENKYDSVRNGHHHQTKKTHCPKGHPLVPRPGKYARARYCPICDSASKRRYKERIRTANRAKTHCSKGHELHVGADDRKYCTRCKRESTRDSLTTGRGKRRAEQVAQTHCKYGHEFTPENTYASDGRRVCRKCSARRQAAYRERTA